MRNRVTSPPSLLCVDYSDPHPNIDLPARHHRLRLELNAIAAELTLPPSSGIKNGTVHNWRGTLASGFSNGLREAFPREPHLPSLTLELTEATPFFAPGAVQSKTTSVDQRGLSAAASSAVEAMYEKIAADLFTADDRLAGR
jgi:hypothetical protein